MNYLGHARFSGSDAALLAGNMMGDYVKGKTALELLPPSIQAGVSWHRDLDAFTDGHAASLRAALPFREVYRRYAPAIVDTLFDHFLANDPRFFPSQEALQQFTQATYAKLDAQKHWFPETFLRVSQAMAAQDWLYHYRTLGGIRKSLGGLQRRARYLPEIETAYQIFIGHYHIIGQCWQELGDALAGFANNRFSQGM